MQLCEHKVIVGNADGNTITSEMGTMRPVCTHKADATVHERHVGIETAVAAPVGVVPPVHTLRAQFTKRLVP